MISPLINGISPVLPGLIITVIAILSFFTAWWSYQYLYQIDIMKKVALILLRGAALFILIMLLINPFILTQTELTDQPSIAVYYDNSQSMSVERGQYHGYDEYNQIVDEFRSVRDNSFQYSEYLFSDEVRQYDQINLSGTRTNFNTLLEHLRERERRHTAAIIFSDGIITQGRNPLFTAQNITIPVITVPVGDTSSVKDVAIADVEYSPSVYSYTSQNIQIEIQQEGFEGEFIDIQITRDGDLIESFTEELRSAVSSQVVEFFQEYDEPGFYEYEIYIPPLPEEYTTQNNRTTFTVEVLDDKTRILSIASEIHPDVSSIRRVIATDQQNELSATMYLGNGRFVGVNPLLDDLESDLIVLHGIPEPQSALYQWILQSQTPLLIHLLPTAYQVATDYNISELTGFNMSSITVPIQIQFDLQRTPVSHPILELSNPPLGRLPSLQTFRSEYNLSALSEPIIMSLFERTETDIPMIISEDTSILRKAVVTAYGWFRYEQNNDPAVRELFQNLITNLVSWTSTPPDRRLLTIYPQKDTYSENEIIAVRAELFNELGEPEPEAFIDLTVYQGESEDPLGQVRMRHQQNENYIAELGNYPQGIYRLRASATKNERIIGNAESRVIVSESIIEFLNTKRDDQTLSQIAEITGGHFLENRDLGLINDLINEYQEIDAQYSSYAEEVHFLYRSGYWFLIVLVFLSAEWIIRRSVSLP